MHTEEITSELRRFIREQFAIPEDDPDFSDEIDLFNYGYIDSFGAVELTGFIERQFGTTFADSDWTNFPLSSIREISTFVAKRLEEESNHA
jgi:D-alanine--poly(phosphoribitol) ligase subunit 2